MSLHPSLPRCKTSKCQVHLGPNASPLGRATTLQCCDLIGRPGGTNTNPQHTDFISTSPPPFLLTPQWVILLCSSEQGLANHSLQIWPTICFFLNKVLSITQSCTFIYILSIWGYFPLTRNNAPETGAGHVEWMRNWPFLIQSTESWSC